MAASPPGGLCCGALMPYDGAGRPCGAARCGELGVWGGQTHGGKQVILLNVLGCPRKFSKWLGSMGYYLLIDEM